MRGTHLPGPGAPQPPTGRQLRLGHRRGLRARLRAAGRRPRAPPRHPPRPPLHRPPPRLAGRRAPRRSSTGCARLVAAGRVELLGGGYYEPVLASLPERDRLAQLRLMGDTIERIGGRRPTRRLARRAGLGARPAGGPGRRRLPLDDPRRRPLPGRLDRGVAAVGRLHHRRPGPPADRLRLGQDPALPASRSGRSRTSSTTCASTPRRIARSWPSWATTARSSGRGRARSSIAGARAAGSTASSTPSTANADWIELVTPERVDRRASGRSAGSTCRPRPTPRWANGPCRPTRAWPSSTRWPPPQAEGRPEARWLRGGFWRNFQVKYREINDLHKQMLRTSAKVAAMPRRRRPRGGPARAHAGPEQRLLLARRLRRDLHRPHAPRHVRAPHRGRGPGRRGRPGGRPGDRRDRRSSTPTSTALDELLVTSPGQTVVIDPFEGGGIGSWDIRAVRHALAAVMRRRPEAYHQRLIDSAAPAAEAAEAATATGRRRAARRSGAVASIHAVVRSREPGLADRLQYDGYERRSGLVHLFAPGTTREAFARAEAVELGDAHTGRVRRSSSRRGRRASRWPATSASPGGDDRPGREAVHPRRRPARAAPRPRGRRREPLRAAGPVRPGGRVGDHAPRRRRQPGRVLPGRRRPQRPRRPRRATPRRRSSAAATRTSGLEIATSFEPAGHRLVDADRDGLELRVRLRADLPGQRARRRLAGRAGARRAAHGPDGPAVTTDRDRASRRLTDVPASYRPRESVSPWPAVHGLTWDRRREGGPPARDRRYGGPTGRPAPSGEEGRRIARSSSKSGRESTPNVRASAPKKARPATMRANRTMPSI